MSQSPINLLVRKIRDHVNKPWKHYWLRQNKAMFSQLCSSMDMIDDADYAIRAFEVGEFPESKPSLYLATVGVLQALIVQQDAVFHLAEALGYNYSIKKYPDLIEIRNIRHQSVGHPTKKERPKSSATSYNHIIQISLTKHSFELLSFMEDGNIKHSYIDLQSEISRQTKNLSDILSEILEKLEAEEMEHKKRFQEEKLSLLLNRSISYHSDKIVEAAYLDNEPQFGLINLKTIIKIVHTFRDSIKERDMELFESLDHEYEIFDYLEYQLSSFFQARIDDAEPPIDQLGIEIFAKSLRQQIWQLIELADHIDAEYEE